MTGRKLSSAVLLQATILALELAAISLPAYSQGATAVDSAVAAGRRIYLEGMLPSNLPLHGLREGQGEVVGAMGACVSCHRRSGLGSFEGNSVIPPITDKYLRRSATTNINDVDMGHVQGYRQNHVAYTDSTLARSIRTGVASDGRTLSVLMPRYALDEVATQDLLAYLRQLGTGAAPGVSDTTLQFATIITPDADPVEREAMLAVMQRFFANQTAVIAAETRPMKTSREIAYRVTRQWRLHVWELRGPQDSWTQQLHDHMTAEPVFAVLSGLGRSNWKPVRQFCESNHVPCLFPNIDVPASNDGDFYTAYFSRGVFLEADLLAQWLTGRPAQEARHRRLVQVYRQDDAGIAGAAALRTATAGMNWEVLDRPVSAHGGSKALSEALAGIQSGDLLMLWLRPLDLKSLPPEPPSQIVLASGLMGGLESAPFPAGWRKSVHMAYPVDLPERRVPRMNFPYGWFKVQHIPITAERIQIDTYLACVITSETVGGVFDNFVPDFLVERLEMMVGRRLANAYFPRLGLAPGQRFASKGGFIVHFADDPSPLGVADVTDSRSTRPMRVIADGDWITP